MTTIVFSMLKLNEQYRTILGMNLSFSERQIKLRKKRIASAWRFSFRFLSGFIDCCRLLLRQVYSKNYVVNTVALLETK